MTIESRFGGLRKAALAVTIFSLLLAATGLVQIGFGAIAVSEEYARIEQVEEQTRQRTYYGYQRQQAAIEAEYRRSSGAFFSEGRFIPSDDRLSPDDPALLTGIAMVLSALGFFVAAMIWVWRAHANLAKAGLRAKFTPAKAVASYLVPIVNLMLPFEAMRELYNRSHGENEDFAHAPVDDVTAWWTAVVIGLLLMSAMIVKFGFDAVSNLIIMTPLWMEFAILAFAIILLLAAASLFAGLARKITAAQEEYLAGMAEDEPVAKAPRRMAVRSLGAEH